MRLPASAASACSAAGLLVLAVLPSPAPAQTASTAESSSAAAASQAVTAIRTDHPITLDGLDSEPVWRTAPVQDAFREARPSEGADPKQRTAFRVAYDPENLYVFVRAYDTSPDSIIALLSRRDVQTASDQIIVMIDSYRDRRTGYEFVTNPVGVKADYAIYNDGQEDGAWDAVWDVGTRVDSLGWTAEYRIPFSQLRFTTSDDVTFGFLVWRTLQRHTSQLTWPHYRPSQTGFVSQFGELRGLTGLARPRRLEVVPYVLTQNEPIAEPGDVDRRQKLSVGGDLKYAVASNLTLTATVNPDFGQVEADPAVLNLSAFETFFREQRPFFVSGAGLFDFRVNCFVVVDCNTGENLFYSRRIGRSPRLAGRWGDDSSPASTRIIGAAKLAGRMPGGLSVGFLDAVTDRVSGVDDATIEPTTNYAVLRANQEWDEGNASVGLIATGVNRRLDEWSEPFLHSSAYAGGLDARRRLGRFEVSGSLMGSRVAGTPEAIAATQREPVHNFQRPDDELELDPARTSLTGHSGELRFAKVAGRRTVFETGYGRRSAGFDVNDLGFLRRANEQTWTNWFQLRFNEPNRVFQRLSWNFNWWQYWTLEGLPTDRAFNTNVHTQFNNRWWLHLGGTVGAGSVYCDRNCTRGGPALKTEPGFSPWMGIEGDSRRALYPSLWLNYSRNDGGRSQYYNINPSVRLNVSDRFSTSFGVNYSRNDDDSQWFGNFTDDDDVQHYTFAELNQRTLGVTWRLNYTFTPTASLQLYANPFISKGTYSRVRELADPRADEYEDRFQPYLDPDVADDPGGFNVKAFRSNVVFRWEYRPSSTLFVVWSQGREQEATERGDRTFWGDFDDLFDQRAQDVFLVKVSYWLNR